MQLPLNRDKNGACKMSYVLWCANPVHRTKSFVCKRFPAQTFSDMQRMRVALFTASSVLTWLSFFEGPWPRSQFATVQQYSSIAVQLERGSGRPQPGRAIL